MFYSFYAQGPLSESIIRSAPPTHFHLLLVFLGGSDGKESACNAEGLGPIPGLGRSPREGKGYPLQILAWRIPWTV